MADRIRYDYDEGFFVDMARPLPPDDAGEVLYEELTTSDVIALVNELSSKLDAAQNRIAELEAAPVKCSFDDCNNTVRRPICDDCDHLLRMED